MNIRALHDTVVLLWESFCIGLYASVTRIPVRRAHFAICFCELERVDEAESLVDAAADREVINRYLSDTLALPIARNLEVLLTCLTTPLGSIMKQPLNAIPSSSINTP